MTIGIILILLGLIANGFGTNLLKCPQNLKLDEWSQEYYDNATNACYPHGRRGPCGQYMLWYQKSNGSEYGVCSCIAENCGRKLRRPLTRFPKDNQCYLTFDQGPCNKGEWLVFDKNWQGVCQPNKCLQYNTNAKINETIVKAASGFIEKNYEDVESYAIQQYPPAGLHPWDTNKPFNFFYNGTCHTTLTQDYCKEGEVIGFFGTLPKPVCFNPFASFGCGSTTNSGELQCPNGFQKQGDDCIPMVKVQWD